MTSHPDVEALAFFAEELLEPDEERDITAHIDACESCAATLAELTGVSRVLAATPAPQLPQDVADLLDQRVTEAVRDRSAQSPDAGEDPADPPSGEDSDDTAEAPVTPISRGRRRFGLPRLMVVAAAAIFAVGGGTALLTGVLSSDRVGEEGNVSAPLAEDEEGAGSDSEPEAAQAYTPEVVSSGTVYTEADLPDQAVQVLEQAPESAESGEDTQGEDTLSAQEEGNPPLLDECAEALGEEFETRVTLVDDAAFESDGDNEPAWVLFAPDGAEIDVYVVDTHCAPTAPDILAEETVEAP